MQGWVGEVGVCLSRFQKVGCRVGGRRGQGFGGRRRPGVRRVGAAGEAVAALPARPNTPAFSCRLAWFGSAG